LRKDLAQESFLFCNCHRTAWGTIAPERSQVPGFKIASHATSPLMSFRQGGHTRPFSGLFDRLVEFMRPRTLNPEARVTKHMSKTVGARTVPSLPEDQRTALLLREQEHLSYRELAKWLNVFRRAK